MGGLSDTLETPTPYAAADVITHDESGRLSFHYAIIEVQLVPHMDASQSCRMNEGKNKIQILCLLTL